MGAWGTTAFESDGALDFLGNLSDRVRGMTEDELRGFTPLRALLDHTPYDEQDLHGQAELLAAVLGNDWSAYRVGGGSGLMSGIRGEEKDPRAWLPDDTLVLVSLLREGAYHLADADREAVVDKALGLAGKLERLAAETRSSNPEGWTRPEERAEALEATAGRLRAVVG